MSSVHTVQSADGAIIRDPNNGLLNVVGTSVPSDATAGYSKGCIFVDKDASQGAQVFINEGSNTSCDFNAVPSVASSNTFSGANVISGSLSFTGALRHKVVQITTTSVLTTTTLTQATHAGAMVVITSGTSRATKRHRIKLPNATTATAGDVYTICNGIAGVLTSNGIMVKGTTLDSILGGAGAGKNLKSSTRGTVGTCIALQAVTTNTYAIVGRANGIAAASTSLVWRTT